MPPLGRRLVQMTTPDPDRKSTPFEWRALTINKVERIQLERLRKEQDRIERELREQEAKDRAAAEQAAQEQARDALEQAWFDQGKTPDPVPDELDAATRAEVAAFASPGRLSRSLAAWRKRLTSPPPKPRPSQPPPPMRESTINPTMLLAACAFGTLVYLSLRWVADVRQAHVTQQLTSSVNATATVSAMATASSVAATPPAVNVTPKPTQSNVAARASKPPAAPVVATLTPQSPLSAAEVEPANAALARGPNVTRSSAAQAATPSALAAAIPEAVRPAADMPKALPETAAAAPAVAAPTPGSGVLVRPQVLIPAAGTPHTSGARVYRRE